MSRFHFAAVVLALGISSAAVAQAPWDGAYRIVTDGARGTLTLNGGVGSISIAAPSCAGALDGTVTQAAPDLLVLSARGGQACSVALGLAGGRVATIDQGPGCTFYHGASCAFSGQVDGPDVPADIAAIDAGLAAFVPEGRVWLQRVLTARGHYRGPLDGTTGPGTRGAIIEAARAAVAADPGLRLDTPAAVTRFLGGLSAATPSAAPTFHGDWSCAGGIGFSFAPEGYRVDGGLLPYAKVEAFGDGTTYGLTFPDGYTLGLLDVTATTMTWSSPASGDAFDCTRPAPAVAAAFPSFAAVPPPAPAFPVIAPLSLAPAPPFVGTWWCASDLFGPDLQVVLDADRIGVPALGIEMRYAGFETIGGRNSAWRLRLVDDEIAGVTELTADRMVLSTPDEIIDCRR